MESLIANYASSDDEADVLPDQSNRHQPNQTLISSSPSSSSNSKSSSTHATSKLFSALPQPKPNLSSTTAGAKRIVQFRPPIPASLANPSAAGDDEDEDDEGEKEKERKRRRESQSSAHASSVKSFLSSIPAPRNSSTLGALPSAGSGRRSILDTDSTAPSSRAFEANDGGNDLDAGNSVNYQSYVSGTDQTSGNLGYSEDYTSYQSGYDQNASGSDGSYYGGSENYANYGEYGNYADYSDYANVAMAGDVQEAGESAVRVSAKRGRNEVPADIVEVKQDELMKNRPREDQVKVTGIAFGPAYQPVSTKGKPSKLHKRKHQIGSLYFDMKQKETELSERRARGFLTKAQTQAKYGW